MVLGICGGSGSGKTYLTEALVGEYTHLKPSVFQLDNYYLPKSQQQRDEMGAINFDLPSALDVPKLTSDFNRLLQGESIKSTHYSYNTSQIPDPEILVHPSSFIIVEGLFLFHYALLKNQLDLSIYIESPAEIQWKRRLERDQLERGYAEPDIAHQWKYHVLPAYQKYILPYRKEASVIFDNSDNWEEQFDRLRSKINLQLTTHD